MKLCFVSVNGPRETYFVDEPRKWKAAAENAIIVVGNPEYEWYVKLPKQTPVYFRNPCSNITYS
jgi:hypothetical protein